MIALLLILFPLAGGLIAFLIKDEKQTRLWALLSSLASLALAVIGICATQNEQLLNFHADWLPTIGARFSLEMSGVSLLLCLLNTLTYPIIFLANWKTAFKKSNNFFGLMLLAQAGMMGVFMAADALLFYFFWELALIPMYFLCSQWGGANRIKVTFKFFVYTFLGSLLMLVSILLLYGMTEDHSFSLASFSKIHFTNPQQSLAFWLMFAAFAVKMPIFPLHTWQPDTYEQTNGATTMVLSGIMVKMGLFGMIRWLFPVMPEASFAWGDVVTLTAIIGMIYASLIALRQDDMKRLVAYSSIAHVGFMCAGLFTQNESGVQGVMIQMFSHGINILGLWIVVDWIEKKTGTRKISELGGVAQKAPALTIAFVIIAFANIALPLTNAFVGEFLIFNGLLGSFTKYYVLYTALAGLCIVLSAAYMLRMVRKVAYGAVKDSVANIVDIDFRHKLALGVLVILILTIGIYPQPILNLTSHASDALVAHFEVIKKAMLK